MGDDGLLKRFHEIETELQALGKALEPPAENKWKVRLENLSKTLISYLPLVSLAFAIAIAIIAKVAYGVDPFESYRAIQTTKNLSRFYSQVGDDLLYRQEWGAAEDAYRSALEINKNNTQATYGIYKAQIFQPLEGKKYYTPQVADAKLDILEKNFPDDYQVAFLRGFYFFSQQNYDNAELWLAEAINKAIKLKKDFPAGHLMLGYVKQTKANMDGACQEYQKALDEDPANPSANNNVGYCELLEKKFVSAIQHLSNAWYGSPNLLTLLNLGDAYLFAGRTNNALQNYNGAFTAVENFGANAENESFVAGEWTYNSMPPYDEKVSKNNFVKVSNMKQKNIFIHYDLSLGDALNHDFLTATVEFNQARQLDQSGEYNLFFWKKMRSIENLVKIDADVQSWLKEHEANLARN